MTPLLTVKDVAKLLQISPRTVYDNARSLGGFYPAGLRVLRFSAEVIGGHISGPDPQGMGLQVRISEESIRRPRLRNAPGSDNCARNAPERSQIRAAADQGRHGL